MGAKLAAQFPGGWTYRIETIREDQRGATHEPAAFPGGFIFVPADLITTARNEAEFAGMLAHAMAHVVVGAPGMTWNAAGLGVPMGVLGLQRANEAEADALAVKAMAAAGYDPAGLASYLRRVQPASGRVAAIQAEIRQLPARTYHAGVEFSAGAVGGQSTGGGASGTHAVPEIRSGFIRWRRSTLRVSQAREPRKSVPSLQTLEQIIERKGFLSCLQPASVSRQHGMDRLISGGLGYDLQVEFVFRQRIGGSAVLERLVCNELCSA